MLDLQSRVRLDEGKGLCARATGDIHQELERAEIGVPDVFREPHGGVDDVTAKLIVQRWCGSDLHGLLEAALDAAFALAQMCDAAFTIAEDLHLDVPGAGDKFFHVDFGTAERGAGLGPAAVEGSVQLIG
jgi:hypothetical protein